MREPVPFRVPPGVLQTPGSAGQTLNPAGQNGGTAWDSSARDPENTEGAWDIVAGHRGTEVSHSGANRRDTPNRPVKPEPTEGWILRTFGSVAAWKKSRTGCARVRFGRPRKEVIHIRLVGRRDSSWRLPCPDRPVPAVVAAAVRHVVTGIGRRPRLAYTRGGTERIAIGRRGEPADLLRAELWATYGPLCAVEVKHENDALAEYVATGGNYRPYARALKTSDRRFLQAATDPSAVERAVVLSDRQVERVWRLVPVYEVPEGDGDVSLGEYGSWAKDEAVREVVIGDPGGAAEQPVLLPMAVPKASGLGKESLYFGFNLDYGGGRRWSQEDFVPPLRIALGGRLNREQGFGDSQRVDQRLPFAGDQFPWGRSRPMPVRAPLGRDAGPAFKPRQGRANRSDRSTDPAWRGQSWRIPG